MILLPLAVIIPCLLGLGFLARAVLLDRHRRRTDPAYARWLDEGPVMTRGADGVDVYTHGEAAR